MNRIKQLRKEKGLSQKELGAILNINVPTISKYESEDVDISASKLRILSELFNTSIDYILCNDKKELDVMLPSSKTNKDNIQLSTDERELVKLYRDLPYEGQVTVKAIAKTQHDLYVKPKCDEKAI